LRRNAGAIRRYTYTPQDQMATIVEPGTDIENFYDANGRCIRQINRYPEAGPR
jgi:YD repeat-containing protein